MPFAMPAILMNSENLDCLQNGLKCWKKSLKHPLHCCSDHNSSALTFLW